MIWGKIKTRQSAVMKSQNDRLEERWQRNQYQQLCLVRQRSIISNFDQIRYESRLNRIKNGSKDLFHQQIICLMDQCICLLFTHRQRVKSTNDKIVMHDLILFFKQVFVIQYMKALLLLLLVCPFVSSMTCNLCVEMVEILQRGSILLAPQSVVEQAVYLVCEKKYGSEELCQDVSKQLTPLAIKSGVTSLLKEGRICQRFCGQQFYKTFDLKDIDNQLKNLPGFDQDWQPTYEKVILTTAESSDLKILHLTDIHLDLNYTQQSSTVCNLPICCHIENGFPQTQSVQAKPYGSIKCDTPIKLLDKALDYIEENIHDIDVVIVTGDYSAHNEWEKTPETVKNVRSLIEDKIRQKVNAKYIFTAPGNNEYLPDHQVDPSSVPEESLKVYRVYQPDESSYTTFVSINTLFCDNMNLYLISDQTASIRQLKMLERILEQNENVYLMGHIALSSGSCAESYQLIFRTILNKYKHKILGQFYGHTHSDEFIVNTNPKDDQQISSFSLLAGSLSPLGTGTSRFRTYDLDEESFSIRNYFDYELKLNQQEFGLNYEFKSYYQVEAPVINADVMRSLQQKLETEQIFRKKYADELNGRENGNLKAYCQTYDNQTTISACMNNQLTFSMQVFEVLEMIQGPWGSYGSAVQSK